MPEQIRVVDIEPNPHNPRKSFDPEKLERLAESIKEHGIIQALVVTPLPAEPGEFPRYRLICGERRLRAAKALGLATVPADIQDTNMLPSYEAERMLIENLQREDLDPVEEARAFQTLLKEHGHTQEALGAKLGVSQSHIANRLRLLRLPDEVKDDISRGILSAGHSHALLKLEKAPAVMKKAAEVMAEEQVPVARAADKVKEIIATEGRPLFTSDYYNKPEFKLDGCEKCEFRVMGNRSIYADNEKPYCIKPSCWDKKQQDVRRDRELAVADRVQKMAKKGQGLVDLSKFNYDQYEEFRLHKTEDIDLTECETCEHKKLAKRSYQPEPVDVCFQPSCFKKKQAAATREKNKAARNALQEEINQIAIMAGLKAASMKKWSPGEANQVDTMFVMDRSTLIYIAGMILGSLDPLMDRPTLYRYMQGKYGWDSEVLKRRSWGMLNAEWDVFRRLLETLTDQQLLEALFEWPAVALGLNGAPGWILQQGPGQASELKPAEPRVYKDNMCRELFVSNGPSDIGYGTFWSNHVGDIHWAKDPDMPMVGTREEAQANLDAWAEKRGLQPVTKEVAS